MYTQFFGLKQAPFSIAPDPRYLFMSDRHREALAHLLYGVDSGGGFVLLTGEIGAGKTTVCRCFLQQIPSNCNVAYIFNPKLTVTELLRSVCDEFQIELPSAADIAGRAIESVKVYVDALNHYLLEAHARGENNVLIIDEAQNLSAGVLEQLRLLTNLETNDSKLLQIMLIGQPELRSMLARPELEQLAQRVIARYHLDSLSPAETARYIQHRLSIGGLTSALPFDKNALQQLHRLTNGVPRRINVLCDRALLGGYAENKHVIDRRIVNKAAAEVFGNPDAPRPAAVLRWSTAVAGIAIVAAAGWAINQRVPFTHVTAKAPPAVANSSTGKPSTLASTAPVAAAGHGTASASVSARVPDVANASNLPVTIPSQLPIDVKDWNPVTIASHDENSAYRQLAQLWQVTLENIGSPCQDGAKGPLRCYKSSSGLTEIRQLNRPVILTLRDDKDQIYYALLTGLTNTEANLRIGDTSRSIDLPALARRWRGDFSTFWRAPPGYRKELALGDSGAEVDWLARQLAKLSGIKEPPAGRQFELTMRQQVREFQLAQGLAGDGVAGPRTFMLLNSAAGVNEPRLQNNPTVANVAPGK